MKEESAAIPQVEDDSHTNVSSIHSDFEQSEQLSSLSGDSYCAASGFGIFKGHGLHGREAETCALGEAFYRIDRGASEAFLIRGGGGCGKTCLVESMRTSVTDMGGFFVSAKFADQALSQVPMHSTGMLEAFSDLCDLMNQELQFQMEIDDEDCMSLNLIEAQTSLKSKVGYDHASVFTSFVQNFAPLVGLERDIEFVDILSASQEQRNQFKQASLSFLRAASDQQPLLLFLDDLQFADGCSLDILDALIQDIDSRNILIVCTLRNQHPNYDDICSRFTQDSNKLRIQTLEIKNLKFGSMHSMVSEILNKEPALTWDLSEVILGKTHGNPYFVKNFLDLLRYEGYLRFVERAWTWDISAVSSCTNITENVVEVVATKIDRQHPHVKTILKVAACLAGNLRFPRDVLDRFALEYLAEGNLEHQQVIRDHISQCLAVAVQEGLLEATCSGNKFKFSHGRVYKCALDLLPGDAEERLMLHKWIGSVVWDLSSSGKRDWYVLAAADHLNKGSDLIEDSEERLQLANINIKAAKIARLKSANGPATDFLQKAIALMNHEHSWSEQYPVMLRLHCMAAEMAMNAGRFDDCETLVETVLQHCQTSFDKIPAYFVLTESLSMQCRVEETLKVCVTALALLGEKIPRKPNMLQILYELNKVKSLLRGMSDDDLSALKPLESKEKLASMRLLSSAACFGYISATPELFALVTIRMVKISLQHGASRLTPQALALWALVERSTGQIDASYRFGSLASRMAKELNDPSIIPVTYMATYPFSMHIKDSFHSLIEPLGEAYNTGIQTGQLFAGSIAQLHCFMIMALDGAPLIDLEKQISSFCEASKTRNHKFPLMATLPTWQLVMNLLGDPYNDNPIMLTGTAMDETQLTKEDRDLNNNCGLHAIYYCKLFLGVFFGSWSTADCASVELQKYGDSRVSEYTHYSTQLFFGLLALENYRIRGKRKDLLKGRKIMKELKQLSDSGVICCKAFFLMLKAEETTIRGNMTETSKAYDKAIAACKESKQLPFEALACERAGTFMLRERMTLLCEQYLSRAQQLYRTWGARAKRGRLDMLMETMPTTASRFDMTFQHANNARTIPSDANALAWHPGTAARRGKYRTNGTFQTESKSGTFGEQNGPMMASYIPSPGLALL